MDEEHTDPYASASHSPIDEEKQCNMNEKSECAFINFPAYHLNPLGHVKRHPRNWLRQLLPQDTNASIHPTLKDRALVVAPMVDQSDLPFRLLCRKYGANLCFTPMIHAKMFVTKPEYRNKFWDAELGTPSQDRPLIAQFCGSDIPSLIQSTMYLQHQVDAVDINAGCPQTIAKRGRYGAFLLEDEATLVRVVRVLSSVLDVPVTVKVRLLPSGVEDSLRLYNALVEAGASAITVHGRTRHQKGQETGRANWDAISKVVRTVGDKVPVLSNGSIASMQDIKDCLVATNADGVMSSEAVLEYPALFSSFDKREIGRIRLAQEFLQLRAKHPPDRGGQGSGFKSVRVHLHRMLHADLQKHTEFRNRLVQATTFDELQSIVDDIEDLHKKESHTIQEETSSWYVRHRTPNNTGDDKKSCMAWEKTKIVKCVELDDETAKSISNMFNED